MTICPNTRSLSANKVVIGFVLSGVLALSGCTGTSSVVSNLPSSTTATGQTPQSGQSLTGVILSIRQISLYEDPATSAAALADITSAQPVVSPSLVSSPRYASQGRTLSMVGSAVQSSLAGDNTDDRSHVMDGQEVTVTLDSGGTRMIVQPAASNLKINQRVKIIVGSGEPTRVQAE